MQEYTLSRTGERALKFQGEVVAEVNGRFVAGQDQNRWHEIHLYQTRGGKYVLEIDFRTLWQGESDHCEVTTHDSLKGAVRSLELYDPVEYLLGYPVGQNFSEKQGRLIDGLSRRWRSLLTEILGAIPGTAEEIE